MRSQKRFAMHRMLSAQRRIDQQKTLPIAKAARRFAGAEANPIQGHGGGAPLCGSLGVH